MKQGNIGVTTENIFPIIKKFLYSDHEIFLRELVANAVDATTKLRTLASSGEFKGSLDNLKVKVTVDETAKTITISDNGIGMSADEVEKYINQIAFSGAEEFMAKYDGATGIIGHFGLGFYSAFMVADKVEVISKSYREADAAVHWQCDGSPSYSLDKADKDDHGTDIILHLSEDSAEFASKTRIEGLLTKYCAFLPVAIDFDDKQINDTNPLWTQKPVDITEEQYTEFYRKLYPFADDPLFHIHLNVDYPFNLTGILYFPKIKNNFEVQKNKIQLYCNQVFVTDSVEGIVPEFLTLLHGVIDSPDIPLNVSRSYLQSDSNVKKISSHITKKVADRLAEIFKASRADYEAKWDDLKLFIQYGVVSNEKFGDRASEFTLLKNCDGKYFTIEQYADLIKESQKDKNSKIVFLYASDATAQYGAIESTKGKGYDVLLMDSPLDTHFISFLEHKHSDWSFVRVDSAPAEKLIETEQSLASSLTAEQQTELETSFKAALPAAPEKSADKPNDEPQPVFNVKFEAMGEAGAPVVITQDEFMRRMRDMSRVGGGGGMNFYGQLPDSYNVVVNSNHPLVVAMVGAKDKEKTTIATSLVDLALLAGGLLKGEQLKKFVDSSISALTKTKK